MKRLAENRATKEQDSKESPKEQASGSPTRPYTPESNPLLNGLASLALEAAQKKKAISTKYSHPAM